MNVNDFSNYIEEFEESIHSTVLVNLDGFHAPDASAVRVQAYTEAVSSGAALTRHLSATSSNSSIDIEYEINFVLESTEYSTALDAFDAVDMQTSLVVSGGELVEEFQAETSLEVVFDDYSSDKDDMTVDVIPRSDLVPSLAPTATASGEDASSRSSNSGSSGFDSTISIIVGVIVLMCVVVALLFYKYLHPNKEPLTMDIQHQPGFEMSSEEREDSSSTKHESTTTRWKAEDEFYSL